MDTLKLRPTPELKFCRTEVDHSIRGQVVIYGAGEDDNFILKQKFIDKMGNIHWLPVEVED